MRRDFHLEQLHERSRAGTIDEADRRRLEEHVAGCPECRLERRMGLDGAPQPGDVDRLASAVEAAMARLDAGTPVDAPASPGVAPRSKPRMRAFLLVAAALLLVVPAMAMVGARMLSDPAPAPAVPVEAGSERAPVPETPESPAEVEPEVGPEPTEAPIAVLEPVAEEDPAVVREVPSASELLRRANEARSAGQVRRAIARYRGLQRLHPRSREAQIAHVSLGRLLLDRAGDPRGALGAFDAYLARHPNDGLAQEALVGRARALARLGRTAEERAAWRTLLERFPNSLHAPRARQRLGL